MIHHSRDLEMQWGQLSLAKQLANVGSEVSRMIKWRGKDDEIAERAFERMLELIDLTLRSHKKKATLKEVARAREVIVQVWQSSLSADSPEWDSLNRYFLQFAS